MYVSAICSWDCCSPITQAARRRHHQPEYVKALSDILYHGANSPVARMAAGLQLKNTLTSKDTTVRAMHQQRWLDFAPDVKEHVKRNVRTRGGTGTAAGQERALGE